MVTIADVTRALECEKDVIPRFAEAWVRRSDLLDEWMEDIENGQVVEDDDFRGYDPGISLFYLAYILVARTGSLSKAKKYVDESGIGPTPSIDETAKDLIRIYKSITSAEN
jgi:hypothetical protein